MTELESELEVDASLGSVDGSFGEGLPSVAHSGSSAGRPDTGASHMSDLAKMRAQRSKEMEVPISLTSFKMNCDQRLAVQKVMVIKNLRQAVKAKRQLYGGQIGNMGDIFKAMDKDGKQLRAGCRHRCRMSPGVLEADWGRVAAAVI